MRDSPDPQLAMLTTLSTEELIPSDHSIRRIRVVVDAVLAELGGVFDGAILIPRRLDEDPRFTNGVIYELRKPFITFLTHGLSDEIRRDRLLVFHLRNQTGQFTYALDHVDHPVSLEVDQAGGVDRRMGRRGSQE